MMKLNIQELSVFRYWYSQLLVSACCWRRHVTVVWAINKTIVIMEKGRFI